MGPRWKGETSESKALAEPMSKIVSQLQSSLLQSDAHGLLSGSSVLLAADEEQTDLLNRACFGRPVITADKDKQWFQLGMEEAFYLCHSLKCLKIASEDNHHHRTDEEIWKSMRSKKKAFPHFYKGYCHLRKKNWVVRPGSQYGVDFVAYRHHPALVHSEYAVLILLERREDTVRRLRLWPEVHGTVRLCGSVAKMLLALYVIENGVCDPSSSPFGGRYSVEECAVTRWSPEQCREAQTGGENEPSEIQSESL